MKCILMAVFCSSIYGQEYMAIELNSGGVLYGTYNEATQSVVTEHGEIKILRIRYSE